MAASFSESINLIDSSRPPFKPKDNAARAVRHVLLCLLVVFVARQTTIIHPSHFVVLGKILGYRLCILAMLGHTQVQCFQTQVQ